MGDERRDDADQRRADVYSSARIGAAAALTLVLVVLLVLDVAVPDYDISPTDFTFTLTAQARARGWDAAFGAGVVRVKKVSLVGARGFEPPTSSSRTMRATKLRHAPTECPLLQGRRMIAQADDDPAETGGPAAA